MFSYTVQAYIIPQERFDGIALNFQPTLSSERHTEVS